MSADGSAGWQGMILHELCSQMLFTRHDGEIFPSHIQKFSLQGRKEEEERPTWTKLKHGLAKAVILFQLRSACIKS